MQVDGCFMTRFFGPRTERFVLHELSIAETLRATAVEAIRADAEGDQIRPGDVSEVHLRLGRFAGVAQQSLLFCYDIVTENTILAGSRLVIEELPLVIFCGSCQREVELPGIQSFYCPHCGQPSGDIRQGRELELASIHFTCHAAVAAD